jgi:hypothetical protein
MMQRFRKALLSVIEERIEWPPPRGSPSRDATLYRLRCIASFTNSFAGASKMQRQRLLRLLPNGDWRLQNTVQALVPCGLALPSKEVFVREVAQGILAGLTWEKFKVYERSRWFGAEQAVSGIALVQACHGLLLPSYARFGR